MVNTHRKSDGARLRALALDPDVNLFFTQNSGTQAEDDSLDRGNCLLAIARLRAVRPLKTGFEWRRIIETELFDGEPIRLVVIPDFQKKWITVLDYQKIKETKETEATNDS